VQNLNKMEEKELIKGLEEVDFYFIEKTYFPTYELRLAIRNAIDYIKINEEHGLVKADHYRPIEEQNFKQPLLTIPLVVGM